MPSVEPGSGSTSCPWNPHLAAQRSRARGSPRGAYPERDLEDGAGLLNVVAERAGVEKESALPARQRALGPRAVRRRVPHSPTKAPPSGGTSPCTSEKIGCGPSRWRSGVCTCRSSSLSPASCSTTLGSGSGVFRPSGRPEERQAGPSTRGPAGPVFRPVDLRAGVPSPGYNRLGRRPLDANRLGTPVTVFAGGMVDLSPARRPNRFGTSIAPGRDPGERAPGPPGRGGPVCGLSQGGKLDSRTRSAASGRCWRSSSGSG